MSNETKWTPGPWRVILNSYEHPAVQRGNEGGFVVKGVSKNRETADAHLIAAAPELYECLAHVEKMFAVHERGEELPGDGDAEEWARKTRAALAKARGDA